MSIRFRTFLLVPIFSSILSFPAYSDQKLVYTYDELGRLTFVEDSENGDRDYDYDPAGNRKDLTINGEDPAPITRPNKPAGLECRGPLGRSGGYVATWDPVEGATYYIYEDWDGVEHQLTGTSITKDPECFYVRACNDQACGEKTNF